MPKETDEEYLLGLAALLAAMHTPQVEWSTVQDGNACAHCQALHKKVFTRTEAIFVARPHPYCRCTFNEVPVDNKLALALAAAAALEAMDDDPALVSRQAGSPTVSDSGLTGYACTWEYAGDGIQFQRGSFAKTIAERAGKIPILVTHDRNGTSVLTNVGFITRAEEDEKGLLIYADWLSTPLAKETRAHALAGGITGMSCQAKPIKGTKDGAGVLQTTEAFLREVTLTNVPADINAEVVSVRESVEEEEPEPTEQVTQAVTPEPGVSAATLAREACIREQQIALLEIV